MSTASPQPRATPSATPASLASLAALGGACALLSLFLWTDLVRARAGAQPFCPLGEPQQCAQLWDAPFAAGVQRLTGLPVAGWGLAWGLAAFALPLLALTRLAEGRSPGALLAAVRITAAGGVLAVLVLLSVSAVAGLFCLGCFASYLLTGGYAGIALLGWPRVGWHGLPRGAALAAGTTSAFVLALLYPGRHTPGGVGQAGRDAVAAAVPGGSDASALSEFVRSLDPSLRQTLSDALLVYRKGLDLGRPQARVLIGPAQAPLRVTEFTDVRCEHCAALHETLARLRQLAPGALSIEPRQFPLDGECNPAIGQKSDPVRCLAARVQICAEGRDGFFELAGKLFERQSTLTAAQVYELAAPHVPRPELERCVASPDTARKLREDIELALRYQLEGTPLVLLNGRAATSFAPFLYAMTLTQGASEHPAFAALPPPNPNAHLH